MNNRIKQKANDIFHYWHRAVPMEESDFDLVLAKRYSIKSIEDQIKFIEEEMTNIDYMIRKVYIEELEEIKKELKNLNY